jgi:phosphatidylglycerol:prolipoprotein diacylglycerol transferase
MGTIICAVIGARAFFVIVEGGIEGSFWNIFKIWEGGLVYYGGVIFCAVFVISYSFIKKIKLIKLLDLIAPGIALGHFFGRLGCFSAGCCYGKPAELPWAVEFSSPDSLALTNIPLHPTQIYEAICNIIIFVFLHIYSKKQSKDGRIIALYLILYPIARFIIEFWRFDYRGNPILGLSFSQFISIILLIIGIALYFLPKRNTLQKN